MHAAGAADRGSFTRRGVERVARAGFEPATFHFSGERCYQLSYLAEARQLVGECSHHRLTNTEAVTLRMDASPLSRPRRDSNPRPPP